MTDTGCTPLAGVRVLNTRAARQAEALSGPLRELGAEVVEIPTIEICPPESFAALDAALGRLPKFDWLVLTSVNGVQALFTRMAAHGMRPQALARAQIAAIGPATKQAVERVGLAVEVTPDEYVAESVVAALKTRVVGKRVLLVRAKVARDVIPRELGKVAERVEVVEAYQTLVPRESGAKLRQLLRSPAPPHVVTFTSSSTVRNFAELVPQPADALAAVKTASIGPVTSATLRELGIRIDIEASDYTIPGLVRAIVDAARKAHL